MDRRTVLGRIGAASVGALAAAGQGTASVEREPVDIEGQTYLVRTDIDPDRLDLAGDDTLSDGCCPGCQPKCFACCQQEAQ